MNSNWETEYQETCKTLPKKGDIIPNNGKAFFKVQTKQGAPPHIYIRADVSCIYDKKPIWQLCDTGITCILMPKSRAIYIRKYGLKSVSIDKVRVVDRAEKSLLIELVE